RWPPIMERDADVVVVGAGIVGCATAYFLARRGARVVVLERGPAPGEQSRKNWGFVRQQGRDPLEMPLVMEANRLWRGLQRELGADIGVVTGHGEIRTPTVVCAAGAWSARLARTLGLDLPQRWVRGTVAQTTPAPAVTACAVWGPGVAFRQRRDGSFTIAAGGA